MGRTPNTNEQLRIEELAYGKGYRCRVQVGGSRQTFSAPTKTALKAKVKAAVEQLSDHRRGVDLAADPPPDTYDQACERMLATYPHRPSSRATLEYNLAPSRQRFGSRPIGSITRYEVEQMHVELAGQGLAKTTLRNYVRATEQVYEYIDVHGWLGSRRSPLAGITRARGLVVKPGDDEEEPDPFDSWEDVFSIARAFAWKPWSQMVRFAAGLGLRPQEVLVARACDVDLKEDTFTVNRTWRRGRKGVPAGEQGLGKTHGSLTALPLTPIAREVLLEQQADGFSFGGDASEWESSRLLFPDVLGRVTPFDYWRSSAWKLALADAGVRYRGPGQLRHTFATLSLVDSGLEHIKDVSTAMRHASLATTEKYYVKLVLQMRRNAARTVSAGMPSYAADSKSKRKRHVRAA